MNNLHFLKHLGFLPGQNWPLESNHSSLFRKNGHGLQVIGVLMPRYILPIYLAMDTAIFQANNTVVLAIQLIACSPMNSVMVQKAMIAKTSALARKQPFPFSII